MLIYLITNKINGKQYVGQTVGTLQKRWGEHCQKTSGCSAIVSAIKKYGKDNFTIENIGEALSINELNIKEKLFISKLDTLFPNGYNLTTGGLNYKRSEETKKRMSVAQKGHQGTNTGKRFSVEHKMKLSAAHKGKVFSQEHIKNMSLSRIGNIATEESKAKKRKRIMCNETGQIFDSVKKASDVLGIPASSISNVLNKKRKAIRKLTFSSVQKGRK